MTATITPTLGTRAVVRLIAAGELALCEHCGDAVKFQARHKNQRIIANVYEGSRWDRVEIWHPSCYQDAGEPHGAVQP